MKETEVKINRKNEAEPDYKEMYLELFRATEKAINLLIAAQRKCEDMYIEGRK